MAASEQAVTQGCVCRVLHINCDPTTCDQQRRAPPNEGYSVAFTELQKSAQAGCETCEILLAGLNQASIRSEWVATVQTDDEQEESSQHVEAVEHAIQLVFLSPNESLSRVVIRTKNPSNVDISDWRHFNFNLASTLPLKGCRPFPIRRVFPTESTGSEASFAHLKTWIEDCDRNHKCIPISSPQLPKRVLKVSGNQVRLYQSSRNETAYYTTLSRRWGEGETWVLIRATLESCMRDLPWSGIPQTVKDAIQITRKLGIDYLWMDSMCIIQLDSEDWLEQSREMSKIYGNSWLNIAAIDSEDAHGGCFRETGDAWLPYAFHQIPDHPDFTVMQQPVHTHTDFGANYPTTKWSPILLQRGWVFQERLLPGRVVYYGANELLWECKELSDCQCGGTTVMKRYKPYFHTSFAGGHPLRFVWMNVAGRYSCLDLTFDSDRLVAMAGVAKLVLNSGIGGRYLAGLWEHDLAYQLPWFPVTKFRKAPTYLAPSWSWLSIFGKAEWKYIETAHIGDSHIDAEIVEADIQSSTPDGLDSITGGHIVLNGRVLEVDAEISFFRNGHLPRYTLSSTSNHDLILEDFFPDYLMTSEEAAAIKRLLILFWGVMWGYSAVFFVLRPVVEAKDSGQPTTFKRLGLYLINTIQTLGPGRVDPKLQLAAQIVSACNRKEGIRVI